MDGVWEYVQCDDWGYEAEDREEKGIELLP